MNEELRPLMLRLSQSNINLTVIYAQLLRLLVSCRPKRRRWVHRCSSLRPEQGAYGNLMYGNLMVLLRHEDVVAFCNHTKLCPQMFLDLVEELTPCYVRKTHGTCTENLWKWTECGHNTQALGHRGQCTSSMCHTAL